MTCRKHQSKHKRENRLRFREISHRLFWQSLSNSPTPSNRNLDDIIAHEEITHKLTSILAQLSKDISADPLMRDSTREKQYEEAAIPIEEVATFPQQFNSA